MFKVALGHSEDPYTEDATDEIITKCRQSLGDLSYRHLRFFQPSITIFPLS